MKKSIRILLLLLALCLCLPLVACGKSKTALLTYERNGKTFVFSSRHYTLLASRAKGSLAVNGATVGGYSATDAAFWNYTEMFDGTTVQTLEEYQSARLLESCKFYLVAHALFAEKGLTLPASTIEEIDDALAELIRTDANGSKTKFNSILAVYGVNYDLLREFYLMEEEIGCLKESLYGKNASLVGTTLKNEYLKNYYTHFKLLRLDPLVYLYETDENGDVIFFDTVNGGPLYDKLRGVRFVEEDGRVTYRLPDDNGEPSARYAYDEENGKPSVAMEEDGKEAQMRVFEGDELDAFRARVSALASDAQNGGFDEVYANESARIADDESVSGDALDVYLATDITSGSVLDDILLELETMQPGDVFLLDDENGSFYLFRKETVQDGAYADENLAHWFGGFSSRLTEHLFSDLCSAEFASVKVNESVLKSLPSSADLTPNYYY